MGEIQGQNQEEIKQVYEEEKNHSQNETEQAKGEHQVEHKENMNEMQEQNQEEIKQESEEEKNQSHNETEQAKGEHQVEHKENMNEMQEQNQEEIKQAIRERRVEHKEHKEDKNEIQEQSQEEIKHESEEEKNQSHNETEQVKGEHQVEHKEDMNEIQERSQEEIKHESEVEKNKSHNETEQESEGRVEEEKNQGHNEIHQGDNDTYHSSDFERSTYENCQDASFDYSDSEEDATAGDMSTSESIQGYGDAKPQKKGSRWKKMKGFLSKPFKSSKTKHDIPNVDTPLSSKQWCKLQIFQRPMCLISTNEEGNVSVEENALNQIKKIDCPLVVVAIAGLYRTGKSYLMNRLAGSNAGMYMYVILVNENYLDDIQHRDP
ncbi:cilia- and flagella-associated protein 251-like isoform X7 [Mercenaria mercenaria]|uniref:cilia- and flagella-associated protein 251-like isoform X7 n=1 Tax=Mercenaria mercenaria TaxID=6596 RepID=UPI00234F63A4|nr:cilia- and flagella-associated protein 251-like isoform X7 [Mercenaria mercenaria]